MVTEKTNQQLEELPDFFASLPTFKLEQIRDFITAEIRLRAIDALLCLPFDHPDAPKLSPIQ
jgi:hypothetical protein